MAESSITRNGTAPHLTAARLIEVDTLDGIDERLTPEARRAARERAIARWRLLWGRRGWLGRCRCAGLALSAGVAFLIPNRYVSTTRLMPPDSVSPGTALLAAAGARSGESGQLAGLAGDLLGLKSTGALFVGILESRTIRDDLISRFDLRKVYGRRRWEDARDDLARNTSVGEDTKSGIITLQVTDKRPERAAAMAGEYTVELNRVVTSLNTSAAHRERVFLEQRLSQVQRDLESAEVNFSQFASKNTAIDIEAQGKAMIEAAAGIEGELVATETELESLRQIYSENNVRVRTTEAKAEELRRQLQRLDGKPVDSSGDAAVESASAQDSIYPSIRKLPLLGVNYADLYRNTKVQEAVYEALTQEYELAKVEEAKETPSVKVIDVPEIPEKKSGPPRLLIVLAGTAAFGLAAAGWILGEARWEKLAADDPGKALLLEMFAAMKGRSPAAAPREASSPNGSKAPDDATGVLE